MESLKERLLEHARWHDKHGCAASAVLLREASEALGVSPPAECRCDCVNCVTGNHQDCYYRPSVCPSQHQPTCASWRCAWEWRTDNGAGVCRQLRDSEIHYVGTVDSHQFVPRDCDCRASSGVSPSGGWQAIESAPKDGRPVLAWPHYHMVRFSPIGNCWWRSGAWIDEPTHWMPLPAPPASPSLPLEGEKTEI